MIPEKLTALAGALRSLAHDELAWLQGYIAALQQQGTTSVTPTETQNPIQKKHAVVYASQTGTAKQVAHDIGQRLSIGTVTDIAKLKPSQLTDYGVVFFVVSTHGEGEPPDSAIHFTKLLQQKNTKRLTGMSFAVVGLGDRSYEHFCGYAHALADQLVELGATHLEKVCECDIDYQSSVDAFIAHAPSLLQHRVRKTGDDATPRDMHIQQQYTEQEPCVGEVQSVINLCTEEANKVVRHVEFYAPNLHYTPGDCLGIVHDTPPVYVEHLLEALDATGNVHVQWQGKEHQLAHLLSQKAEVVVPSVRAINALATQHKLDITSQDAQRYASVHNWLTLIRQCMQQQCIDVQHFVSLLPAKKSRLYSIASCPVQDEEQLHILVKEVRKKASHATGLTSSMYMQTVEEESAAKIFVKENTQFRLPADTNRPIIMIAAGTGIAPFRSFLRYRHATGASGKNWLLFGEQYFKHSFFYQTEWQDLQQEGVLHRIDTAFSRDAQDGSYIHQHLVQQGGDVMNWLADGAVLYVCGGQNTIGKSVNQALLDIVLEQKKLSQDAAEEYIDTLRVQGQYLRDVY